MNRVKIEHGVRSYLKTLKEKEIQIDEEEDNEMDRILYNRRLVLQPKLKN